MANYAGVNNVFALNGVIAYATVNANFAGIIGHMDTHLMHRDALLPFTGLVTGPSTDCVSADQFTRKAYVDALAVWQTADTDSKTGFRSYSASAASFIIPTAGVWHLAAEAVIANPAKAVSIMAWGSGFLQGPVAFSTNQYECRLSYSLNNGVSYTPGPQQFQTAESAENPWRSFAPILRVGQGGVVNDLIKVKIEVFQVDGGTPVSATFWEPYVMVQIFQEVNV